MPTKKIFEDIQLLRGFAILGVIAIHVSPDFQTLPRSNPMYLGDLFFFQLVQWAVPLFIFISGFVLSARYKSSFLVSGFYKKRFGGLLPPFIIFSFLYLIFTLYFKPHVLDQTNFTNLAFNLITGRNFFHLWFFPVIFQMYILFPVLLNVYKFFYERKQDWKFVITVFAIQIVWHAVIWLNVLKLEEKTFYNLTIFSLVYWAYFIAGIFCFFHVKEIREKALPVKILWIGTAIIVLNSIRTYSLYLGAVYWHGFLNIPASFKIINILAEILQNLLTFILLAKIALWCIQNKLANKIILEELAQYSFGIYLVHAGVFVCVRRYLEVNGFNYQEPWVALTFITTVVISFLLVKGISRLPASRFLVGDVGRLVKR